ncbi:hypothetical protein EVAR_78581_1 [Eumeta japonica]|uniref:Uncharacterized protein n=1 Tax=Eumeta variegata TaxID=151549 RepID=A0A4C1W691_EUMVA|nr:hypothetical protein EVAR_78581_1 [Eumeta japonica]
MSLLATAGAARVSAQLRCNRRHVGICDALAAALMGADAKVAPRQSVVDAGRLYLRGCSSFCTPMIPHYVGWRCPNAETLSRHESPDCRAKRETTHAQ